jgi:hypothetical protein
MPDRVLHVHVGGLDSIPSGHGDDQVTVTLQILVGIDGDDPLSDSLPATLTLKTLLGLYKTAIQLNVDVAEAAKAHMYSSQSIPTNGYAAVYVSGAYGLLSIL